MTLDTDLPTSPKQFPVRPTPNECDYSASENALRDVPVSLPECEAVNTPSVFIWGQNSEGKAVTITTSMIDDFYNEITKWWKNILMKKQDKT